MLGNLVEALINPWTEEHKSARTCGSGMFYFDRK
jgi:hypothetical protein